MGWFLKASLLAREWRHNARFEQATREPESAQATVLQDLVRRNADTAFGGAHGFAKIRSHADYTRDVPVRDYEGFRPHINAILSGAQRILTAESPYMFTSTSGTTGEPKLVPVTASWRELMASLTRLWMLRAARDHPGCWDRKGLSIVSAAVEGRTAGGIRFGAMSGVTYQRIPWLVRRQYALPYEAALIKDYDTRYFVSARLALASSVSMIGTPNPSSLIRLAETAEARGEEIIRAIHDGVLGVSVPEIVTAGGHSHREVIAKLKSRISPDPERARFLSDVAEKHGKLMPGACWPELRLIGCWLGGSVGIHARRLADHYGTHAAMRDLGLWASEGRMTIPVEDDSAAGPLAVHAGFFEFISEDDIEKASPTVLLAHQLEEGKRYYIILSGANGLYRYDMNDIIEVRGFYNRTPKVAFARKGRDMVSITGEKLHLNQIQAAIREAEERSRLEVIDADAAGTLPFFNRAIPARAHYDHEIVEEAWDEHRTIVTSNARDFVHHIRRFQNPPNNQACRDLYGVLVLPNAQLDRERGLKTIMRGLDVRKNDKLRWSGAGFLNLYVRLTASGQIQIHRFKRCAFCEHPERGLEINKPWDAWYRSLPIMNKFYRECALSRRLSKWMKCFVWRTSC